MMKNEDVLKEFENERSIFAAEPIKRMTKSWLSLEDTSDNQKAKELYYEALEGNKLYMVPVNDKFVKLYIKNSQNIWKVYVERHTLYPGAKYHSNQQN